MKNNQFLDEEDFLNQVVDDMLQELQEDWGYDSYELSDIRKKMVELVDLSKQIYVRDTNFSYGVTYGKKSDNE